MRSYQDFLALLKRRAIALSLLLLLILGSAALKLYNLGHEDILFWDELLHAIVARNLAKHPLQPTLYDPHYLPYDYRNWWIGNHVWLHKPPLALWQIAFSYTILGVNAFALRLPSLILSTLTLIFTYLIGVELYNRKVGYAAAFLQAISPFLLMMVQGYVFSDHIDTALIFWVEVSCYFLIKGLKSGSMRYFVLSGVAQGLGYLSKSYLCLVPFGIAAGLFALSKLRLLTDYRGNLSLKKLFAQLGSSLLLVSPWVLFCLVRYRREYLFEEAFTFAHFSTSIEGWQRSWDYHIFNYMPSIYPYLYMVVLASFALLLLHTIRERRGSDTFLSLWVLGVVVTLSAARSKVPAGTDVAIPAFLLCVSYISWRAIRDGGMYAVVLFSSVLVILLSRWPLSLGLVKDSTLQSIFPLEKQVPALFSNLLLLRQFLLFFILFAAFAGVYAVLKLVIRPGVRIYSFALKLLVIPSLALLVVPIIREDVRALRREVDRSFEASSDVGEYVASHTPENSVLFLESNTQQEKYRLMFYADRSAYLVAEEANLDIPEGSWAPKGLKIDSLEGLSIEGDFMVDRDGKFLSFNISGESYDSILHFMVRRADTGIVGIYGRKDNIEMPLMGASAIHEANFQTSLNTWYRARITAGGFQIKESADPTDFGQVPPLIQANIASLLKSGNYRVNLMGYGYLDNIRVLKDGEQLFFDDFEAEEPGTMPSRWEFFGGTIGEAMIREDPDNPSNKVLFLNSPTSDPRWLAGIVRERGGVPYLVSVNDYDYPILYESSVSPRYRVYELR